MSLMLLKNTALLFVLIVNTYACNSKVDAKDNTANLKQNTIENNDTLVTVGANRTAKYLPLLKGKRVALVTNQTSVIFKNNGYTHLVDSLVKLNVNVKKVFAPEHGFRGTADAGELVKDGMDTKTGLPIISLYGKQKKPNITHLGNVDILVFDIQDVGARFYTYISSLHYIMEACAEQGIPVLVLDRPNPNGHYIDGPILESKHKSFIGMHPIPIVHGMTIGEYAQMINGEGWLDHKMTCDLTVIPVKNYTHQTPYNLPIKPSPNLPNDTAINLYPSLCLFEGTNISIGRGTETQFQVVGTPFFYLKRHYYMFTPKPNFGSKYPKHDGKPCHGYDLSKHERLHTLNLDWLIEFYNTNQHYAKNQSFFTTFFTKLAGTEKLQKQIEAGMSEGEIKESWVEGLETYNKMRKAYLIYDRIK